MSTKDRNTLENLGKKVTTQFEKGFPKTLLKGTRFAKLVLVPNLDAFLSSPRDSFGWRVRLVGAAVADDLWMRVVSQNCSPAGLKSMLPPPGIRFQGLRTPTRLQVHESFKLEAKSAIEELERAAAMLPRSYCAWTIRSISSTGGLVAASGPATSARQVLLCGAAEKKQWLEQRAQKRKKVGSYGGSATSSSAAPSACSVKTSHPLRIPQRLWDVTDLWKELSATFRGAAP